MIHLGLRSPLEPTAIVPAAELRADEHPVAVYLADLSASSRRTMATALDTIARILTGDEESSAWDVPWQ